MDTLNIKHILVPVDFSKSSINALDTAMNLMRELGDSLSNADKVRYVVEVSNHWRNLVRQVQDEQADLLVTGMPTSGESTPGRLTALMYNSCCALLWRTLTTDSSDFPM